MHISATLRHPEEKCSDRSLAVRRGVCRMLAAFVAISAWHMASSGQAMAHEDHPVCKTIVPPVVIIEDGCYVLGAGRTLSDPNSSGIVVRALPSISILAVGACGRSQFARPCQASM